MSDLNSGDRPVTQVQLLDAVQMIVGRMETRIDASETKILEQIAAVRLEVATGLETVRTDVQTLRADVQTLRADVESLRADVESLRADVESLRADVESLRADVESLRADVESLRSRIEAMRAEALERAEGIETKLLRAFFSYQEFSRVELRKIKADLSNINAGAELRFDIIENRLTTLDKIYLSKPPEDPSHPDQPHA